MHGLVCSRCHAALARGDAAFCAGCLAPHHPDCFASRPYCATPRCEANLAVRAARRRSRVRPGLLATGLAAIAVAAALGSRDLEPDEVSWSPERGVARREALAVARRRWESAAGRARRALEVRAAAAPNLERVVARTALREARGLLSAEDARLEEQLESRPAARLARLVDDEIAAIELPCDDTRWQGQRDAVERFFDLFGSSAPWERLVSKRVRWARWVAANSEDQLSIRFEVYQRDVERCLQCLAEALEAGDDDRAHGAELAVHVLAAQMGREERERYRRAAPLFELRARAVQAAPRHEARVGANPVVSLLACQDCRVALGADVVFCASCVAPHHPTCFVARGGCASPGCAERLVVRARRLRPGRLSPGVLAAGSLAIVAALGLRAANDLQTLASEAEAVARRQAREAGWRDAAPEARLVVAAAIDRAREAEELAPEGPFTPGALRDASAALAIEPGWDVEALDPAEVHALRARAAFTALDALADERFGHGGDADALVDAAEEVCRLVREARASPELDRQRLAWERRLATAGELGLPTSPEGYEAEGDLALRALADALVARDQARAAAAFDAAEVIARRMREDLGWSHGEPDRLESWARAVPARVAALAEGEAALAALAGALEAGDSERAAADARAVEAVARRMYGWDLCFFDAGAKALRARADALRAWSGARTASRPSTELRLDPLAR